GLSVSEIRDELAKSSPCHVPRAPPHFADAQCGLRALRPNWSCHRGLEESPARRPYACPRSGRVILLRNISSMAHMKVLAEGASVKTSIEGRIAQELGVREAQVTAAAALLDDGATVPFVARYRKEATGGLDDAQLRTLEERLRYLRELEERRT